MSAPDAKSPGPIVTRADHLTELVPLTAADGTPLSFLHVRTTREPTRGPVMLVHGSGVRAESFRPPVEHSLVDALLHDGWDVWLLNWRASIDLEPVPWTLDDAAVYDLPPAVAHVIEATGASQLKVVAHCQGSSAVAMAAVAGLLPDVDTVVSNAVFLHPVVPRFSRLKLAYLEPALRRVTPYLSPAWGYRSQGTVSRLIRGAVQLTHRECDNTVCRLVSFTYGSGRPALWSHHHLDDATHDWLTWEFAEVPMSFFDQMRASVHAGRLIKSRRHPEIPDDLLAGPPRTDARFVFLTGADNRCFLPESQRRSHAFFDRHRPGLHALHVLPGYGHLDVFFGRYASRDVFPTILEELNK